MKLETSNEKSLNAEAVSPLPGDLDKIIKNHVVGSMGVGLIPLPVIDFVSIMGIQINLLRKLAKSYNIPFSQDKVKNILGSMIGGGLVLPIGGVIASLCKSIPVIGHTTGAVAMPVTAGASTYAIGKVFNQHFASGGTFLNFDPEKVREYYKEMYKEGEKLAPELKMTSPELKKASPELKKASPELKKISPDLKK